MVTGYFIRQKMKRALDEVDIYLHSPQKRHKSCHWAGTLSKAINMYHLGTNMYILEADVHP